MHHARMRRPLDQVKEKPPKFQGHPRKHWPFHMSLFPRWQKATSIHVFFLSRHFCYLIKKRREWKKQDLALSSLASPDPTTPFPKHEGERFRAYIRNHTFANGVLTTLQQTYTVALLNKATEPETSSGLAAGHTKPQLETEASSQGGLLE